MSTAPDISQRDLRLRSKEIMDSVERGQSFTVTRDGRRIATLAPMPRGRRFVIREEFAQRSRNASTIDLDRFRADQERASDPDLADPYGR